MTRVILAETSLAGIGAVVTMDEQLLNVSREALQIEFQAADLNPVTVAHPRLLLRALH